MKIFKFIVLGISVFFTLTLSGQNQYVLDLKAEKWNAKQVLFYISDVFDERSEKSHAGKVFSGNKLVTADFKISLEKDLKYLIDASMEQDSSLVPLFLSLKRFELKTTGTYKNQKIVLDFSILFYRIINEKRYNVFETKGMPEMVLQGSYANAPEKIIRESLKSVINGFNDWINQQTDLPPLARTVRVVFEKENKNINTETGDTIIWNKNYKLKWSDFKGNSEVTSFMAQSNCIFSYRAEPKTSNSILNLNIRLNACFDRRGSWVKTGQQKDPLLAHEQLHFDICEIYVHHLRNKILGATLNPMEFDIQINLLFEEVWKAYLKKQQQYDEETGHGIITDKQLYWEEEIRSQLKNTSLEKD